MVKRDIVVRRYKSGDEKGINDLFEKIFHVKRTLEEWNWKYLGNPPSEDPADWIVVVEKNDIITGHYGGILPEMIVGDRTMRVPQPVDTMMDPDGGSGIRILKRAFTIFVEGVFKFADFGFGFPNEKAYLVGTRFLGYIEVGKMVPLMKRLSINESIKRRFRQMPAILLMVIHYLSRIIYKFRIICIRPDKHLRTRMVDVFDERVNALWASIKKRFDITTVRNLSYLQWRYQNPRYTKILCERDGELTGYGVVSIKDSMNGKYGYVLDIMYEKEYRTLLKSILEYFLQHDVDYVLCALTEKDPMIKQLRMVGFRENKGFASFPLVYFPNPATDDTCREFLKEIENWHLTYGDLDGF